MSLAEDIKQALNPLEEVKKLQDLVRKLEIQNQQLRCKQNRVSKTKSRDFINISNDPVGLNSKCVQDDLVSNKFYDDKIKHVKRHKSVNFEDFDLISLEELDLSDEEHWLYVSPKKLSPDDKIISPYKWLRQDVEDLENKELQLARRAFVSKLDQLEILSNCRPELHPIRRERTQVTQAVPSAINPSHDRLIDSRTFTRTKKKRGPGEEEFSVGPLPVIDMPEAESKENKMPESESCNKDISVSDISSLIEISCLTDLINIKEIARMQEESLRQSSPISTPKRQSTSSLPSRKLSGSSRSSISDADNQEFIFSCAATEDGMNRPLASTPVISHTECYRNTCTPPGSPFGSTNSLNNSGNNNNDALRHSLPNLARGQSGLSFSRGKHLSDSKLQNHSMVPGAGQRLQSQLPPQPRRANRFSPVLSNLKQYSTQHSTVVCSSFESTHTVSTIDNQANFSSSSRNSHQFFSKTAKSGLPRPSKYPATQRSKSGIPVPSKDSSNKSADESWSDGCY